MRRRRKSQPPTLDEELMGAYHQLDRIWNHPEMPNGERKGEIARMQMTLLDIWEERRRIA